MKKTVSFLVLLVVGLQISCTNQNRLDVDVSSSSVNVVVERFDQDLFKINTANAAQQVAQLEKKYGNFFAAYVNNYLYTEGSLDSTPAMMILPFVQDSIVQEIQKEITSKFKNITPVQEGLTNGFRHFNYYFPTYSIPRVLSIYGFLQGNIIDSNLVAIGLDSYLGRNHPMYAKAGIYPYQQVQMAPEYIPIHTLYNWGRYIFPMPSDKEDVINNMVYEGKLLYFLDAMFPTTPDTLKMGYTKGQLQWIEDFQSDTWSYLVEKNFLQNRDRLVIENLFGEGPHTVYFAGDEVKDDEAPSRIGSWLGWQMIRKYMNENSDVTLLQLMKEQNYQMIIEKANYKPKK